MALTTRALAPEGSFGISDGPANAFNATVHPVAKPERQDVTVG